MRGHNLKVVVTCLLVLLFVSSCSTIIRPVVSTIEFTVETAAKIVYYTCRVIVVATYTVLKWTLKLLLFPFSLGDSEAEEGLASWYDEDAVTASGEPYRRDALTAAHHTLPFGTMVEVTNLENGRSVIVRINDRGPFVRGRIIDLSYAAARELDMLEKGIAKVRLKVVEE